MGSAQKCDFIIIGAGIAGSAAFYHLTKFASCILIEKNTAPQSNSLIKIFPEHNFSWIPELDRNDPQIFPRTHYVSVYASQSLEATVDSRELQQPFGKVMNQYYLNKWLQEQALQHGEQEKNRIYWEQTVSSIQNEETEILVHCTSCTIAAKAVIIATGAQGVDLQRNLGFATPTILNTIVLAIEGPESAIEKNFTTDYIYRLHPKISVDGPLAVLRGKTCINMGFLSSENYDLMTTKFMRILQNYEPIQGFFNNLSQNPQSITTKDFIYGKCAKHPITNKIKNRILVIGEAAGLITPVYYEGILGCLASAKIAAETLQKLYPTTTQYTVTDLEIYNKEIQRQLNNYFKTADATELIFLKSGNHQQTIWNSYLDCIMKMPKLRKYIHYAYICQDLGNYPLENDEWSGEQIFKNLPFASKVILTPIFLRAKFSS
jgi:flavin-dependent dehydrogenase